jgi:methionine synthase II (cobalamin-independent)
METVMQRPGFAAIPTVVGSFPHTDPRLLTDRILARFAEMPAWPQMPVRDWRESMYVQYSEGLPGAVVDAREQRIYFQGGDGLYAELEPFYQALIEDDVERFAITADYARGLGLFLESVPRLNPRPKWVKGQVTGPFSFAMTVTDQDKRSLAYDPDLYEVAVQGMAMKARWLARRLRQVAECALVTLDEPYLCSFGSAFVNVPRGDVIAAIESAVEAIHKEGALAGLHCCGNTDWSLVLATGLDVINFDAYEYFQGLTLYPEELRAFLLKGGTLSWGIVPASRACADLDAHALLDALDNRIGQLAAKGMDRGMIYRQSLLTPSCGLATESVERADRAVDVLLELSDLVREREGRG